MQAELELEISDPDLLKADLDKADSFFIVLLELQYYKLPKARSSYIGSPSRENKRDDVGSAYHGHRLYKVGAWWRPHRPSPLLSEVGSPINLPEVLQYSTRSGKNNS
ncbi:hypothetical protein E2C01_050698 [Portunus trituberculatus]|uniref:Uncharacterized protein n=1 Tax=Portunus trituberculatus TaxID=210409 RepID=A0A5B7GCT4_PORTR|nr:hypothetical protein [Portunus trituberculatus]